MSTDSTSYIDKASTKVPVWETGNFHYDVPTALGAAAWLMILEILVDVSSRASWMDSYRYILTSDLLHTETVIVPLMLGFALGYRLGLRGVVYAFSAAVLYLAEQHRFQGLWTREGTLWAAGYSYRDDAVALFGTVASALFTSCLLAILSRRHPYSACLRVLPIPSIIVGGLLCCISGLWLSFLTVPIEMQSLMGNYYSQGPFLVIFGCVAALSGSFRRTAQSPRNEQHAHRMAFRANSRQRPLSGVTLTELLVVIGIVMILWAAIMPTYPRAKEKARKVSCMNNLRQIGTALSIYLGDFGDYPVYPGHALVPQYASQKVFVCPDDIDPKSMPGYPYPSSYIIQACTADMNRYYMRLRGDKFAAVICGHHTDLQENTRSWLAYRLNGGIDEVTTGQLSEIGAATTLEM